MFLGGNSVAQGWSSESEPVGKEDFSPARFRTDVVVALKRGGLSSVTLRGVGWWSANRRFRTTYRPHLHGPGSQRRILGLLDP